MGCSEHNKPASLKEYGVSMNKSSRINHRGLKLAI